jgi:two-component system, OmpR family, phosphate regulon sensor histidine kinase PhoR
MKKPGKIVQFRTGIRLASLPALISGILVFLILILFQQPVPVSFVAGTSMAILLFLVIYLQSIFILKTKIDAIRHVIRNSIDRTRRQNKRTIGTSTDMTGRPEPTGPNAPDELQEILQDAERTRESIIKEFKRMNETENFRKEFIGDISHELKTPIFTIQGYLETLQNGALDDPDVNQIFLAKAMNNVTRLVYLTNDLMEISKHETGELKPKIQMIPINSVINDVIDLLQPKADQDGIKIIFEERKINAFVMADRNQIRQVLVNLIENAIKYNKPGGEVSIRTEMDRADASKIRITVMDSGIGMSPDDAKRVTERFYRVDKSRSREQGGTGLGLSIVKHILESHHEQLRIDSKPGVGSTFYFSLINADYQSDLDD